MKRRKTIQSELVFDAVNRLQGHATADEIYSEVLKKYQNISKATVYRNLQRLCENGDIEKREVPGGADRFDIICNDHYHVRCLSCNRLFDVDMDYLSNIENSIKNTNGFLFIKHDIMFKGLCPDCK